MLCNLTLAALVVLAIPSVVMSAEDEIPTATETNWATDIDIRNATPDQVKKWLKKTPSGEYLMSQFANKLERRSWTKAELVQIFGEPNKNPDLPSWMPSVAWMPDGKGKNSVFIIEDRTDEGLKAGSVFGLATSHSEINPGFFDLDLLVVKPEPSEK